MLREISDCSCSTLINKEDSAHLHQTIRYDGANGRVRVVKYTELNGKAKYHRKVEAVCKKIK